MTVTDIVFLIGLASVVGLWCCVAYIVRLIDRMAEHERKAAPEQPRDGRADLVAWGRAYAAHNDRRATRDEIMSLRILLDVIDKLPGAPVDSRRLLDSLPDYASHTN